MSWILHSLLLLMTGFLIGAFYARRLNNKDHEYWMQIGAERAGLYHRDYGSADFILHGSNMYGGEKFLKALRELDEV